MHKLVKSLLLVALLVSMPLQASPLDDARKAGQVSEMRDGYVKASGSASKAVRNLVADVNKRRRSAYGKIAKKNGLSVSQVAAESYARRINK